MFVDMKYSVNFERCLHRYVWIALFEVFQIGFLLMEYSPARAILPGNDTLTDLEEADLHWHLGGIAEAQHDNGDARDQYLAVIEAVQHCPTDIREWFIGTAELAIARCEARTSNTEATKLAIQSALEHHFWNFDIIREDPILSPVVGSAWLDSTVRRWEKIRQSEIQQWHIQQPVVFAPSHDKQNHPHPIIIALHGGNANYKQFAEAWRKIAKRENVIVAVPPGPVRVSDVSNSWSTIFDVNDQLVQHLLDSLIRIGEVDSSKIFLAGYSQGAEQALQMILVHPDRIRGALLLSGFIQQDVPDELLNEAASHKSIICALSGEYEAATLYGSLYQFAHRANSKGLSMELQKAKGMMHELPLDLDSRFHEMWLLLNGEKRSTTGAPIPVSLK
jgi:predicted esterase